MGVHTLASETGILGTLAPLPHSQNKNPIKGGGRKCFHRGGGRKSKRRIGHESYLKLPMYINLVIYMKGKIRILQTAVTFAALNLHAMKHPSN